MTNAASVSFTANGVNQRSYTNPSTVDLGRVLLGTVFSTNATITTAGLHATTTDSTLLVYGGGAINGLTLTGGPTFIDGSNASDNIVRAISGTFSGPAGTQSGTFNLNATDELAGAVTNAAAVSFTANGVNQRSYTNPATVDLGRVLLGTVIRHECDDHHGRPPRHDDRLHAAGLRWRSDQRFDPDGWPHLHRREQRERQHRAGHQRHVERTCGHAERHVQPERDR